MTKEQYTPGPWFYDGQNSCGAHIIRVAAGEIAEVFGCDNDDQQATANAHLIAASPEMLAALEFVRPFLASNLGQAINASELADINRIITKARGGSHENTLGTCIDPVRDTNACNGSFRVRKELGRLQSHGHAWLAARQADCKPRKRAGNPSIGKGGYMKICISTLFKPIESPKHHYPAMQEVEGSILVSGKGDVDEITLIIDGKLVDFIRA